MRATGFDDLQQLMRDVQEKLDPDLLIDTALSIKLKGKDIEQWTSQFDEKECGAA
jgi:hypothetical protein